MGTFLKYLLGWLFDDDMNDNKTIAVCICSVCLAVSIVWCTWLIMKAFVPATPPPAPMALPTNVTDVIAFRMWVVSQDTDMGYSSKQDVMQDILKQEAYTHAELPRVLDKMTDRLKLLEKNITYLLEETKKK